MSVSIYEPVDKQKRSRHTWWDEETGYHQASYVQLCRHAGLVQWHQMIVHKDSDQHDRLLKRQVLVCYKSEQTIGAPVVHAGVSQAAWSKRSFPVEPLHNPTNTTTP